MKRTPLRVRISNIFRNALLHGALQDALELLYPSRCMRCERFLCESRLEEEEHRGVFLCEECLKEIVPPHGKTFCPLCGCFFLGSTDISPKHTPSGETVPGVTPAPSRKRCVHCPKQGFLFSQVIPLGEYEFTLRDAILEMKEERSGFQATHFSRLLFQLRRSQLEDFSPELILPVPMHFSRRFSRGVNSPEHIAETLGKSLNVSVYKDVIMRKKATKPQFSLNPEQRAKNVSGVFGLRTRSFRSRFLSDPIRTIAGKRVLLVDDILTTGTTANEISRVLLQHGAAEIAVTVLGKSLFPHAKGK